MTLPDTEILTSIVGRVFRVDEVTLGDPKKGYFLRYRGELLRDSVEAYDQLAEALRPYDITPLFRIEDRPPDRPAGARHHPPQAGPSLGQRPAVRPDRLERPVRRSHVQLLPAPSPSDSLGQIWTLVTHLWVGWPFAVSLLAILLAHEFGHYFVGRARGAAVSLPYFIPFPFSPAGDHGRFHPNEIHSPRTSAPCSTWLSPVRWPGWWSPSRCCFWVCHNPHLATVTPVPGNFVEGNSLLYLLAKFVVFGKLLPATPEPYRAALAVPLDPLLLYRSTLPGRQRWMS